MKYDYFVAGRTRNKQQIERVVAALRAAGESVYCFLEHNYSGDGIAFADDGDASEEMTAFEAIADWQTNPTLRQIFESDMNALKESANFLLVLPAGLSGHMELGVAFGFGKKCYAIGAIEKVESLYLMIDGVYENVDNFLKTTGHLVGEKIS